MSIKLKTIEVCSLSSVESWGAFFFLIRAKRDTQAPISRQRDGTGLKDSLWVLRSDTATALRRGLGFENFEEEKKEDA